MVEISLLNRGKERHFKQASVRTLLNRGKEDILNRHQSGKTHAQTIGFKDCSLYKS